MEIKVVLVRGAGDLATGVALRLHRSGFPVAMTEISEPLAVRRTVCFSEAVFEGETTVEGVRATLVDDPAQFTPVLSSGDIPIIVDPELRLLTMATPPMTFTWLVDARLLKKPVTPVRVPFVIGLGPGFTPGVNCNAVVETQRGHHLGRVYWDRPAAPDTGLPEGDPARVLRAPDTGTLHPVTGIGDLVQPGEHLATIQTPAGKEVAVTAGLGGVVRGMMRSGARVQKGMKIGDVDPRGERSYCFTVSDKALAIGGGVLEAVLSAAGKKGMGP